MHLGNCPAQRAAAPLHAQMSDQAGERGWTTSLKAELFIDTWKIWYGKCNIYLLGKTG